MRSMALADIEPQGKQPAWEMTDSLLPRSHLPKKSRRCPMTITTMKVK